MSSSTHRASHGHSAMENADQPGARLCENVSICPGPSMPLGTRIRIHDMAVPRVELVHQLSTTDSGEGQPPASDPALAWPHQHRPDVDVSHRDGCGCG